MGGVRGDGSVDNIRKGERRMKRFFFWILCAILLIGAIGCGQKQEMVESLPRTNAAFASKGDATDVMMHFYDENWVLLMALKDDLRSPEHGFIENGIVYPVENGEVLWDSPGSERTESIDAFFEFPYSDSCAVGWDTTSQDVPIFFVSLRWTNDSGYYSTELVYSEDSDVIREIMYKEEGCILEPVLEDGWGVYTVLWKEYIED